jgi:putative ABC transport system substrate-binding protein
VKPATHRRALLGAACGVLGSALRPRPVIVALGGVFAVPVGSRATPQAQPAKRIGVMTPYPPDEALTKVVADAFKARGWELGRNPISLERTGPRDAKGWDDAARELAAAKVDLIVAYGDTTTAAAMRATRTIPIVATSSAPVELGFAQTLARPGGNVTGMSAQSQDENGRVLSLLRDIRPGLATVGIPLLRTNPVSRGWFDSFVEAARPTGIRIAALPNPASAADIAPMLDAAKAERIHALVMPMLPFLTSSVWQPITAWAIEQRVVTRGSLLSRGDAVLAFGANFPAFLRLHVDQIDRVLRGADPATTPFLQPTVWDTVVNQRLARAVGWPAPQSVLLQATEVIQ